MKVAKYPTTAGPGWRSRKKTRPGRDDRRLLTLVKPHTRGPGAKTLLSSLPGRTSLIALFPSTSYRATFIESLPPGYGGQAGTSRGRMFSKSSAHVSKPCVDADGRPLDGVGRVISTETIKL
jgi:hypothetical protein